MTRAILFLAFTVILLDARIAGCASSPGTTPIPTPYYRPTTTALPTNTVPSSTRLLLEVQ